MSDWRRLGCGILIGTAVAFPAGVMFAGRDRAEENPPALAPKGLREKPQMRDFYAPSVAKDPYVLDQQRQLVEGLELQCRQSGEHCAEAEQARRWIDEQHGE